MGQSTLSRSLTNMGGRALPLILLLLSILTTSQAARLARLVAEDVVTTTKTVKINEGIKFENGVLVTDAYNNVQGSEETDDMDDSILFSEEAMKLMEMLADDNVTSSNSSSRFSLDNYHSYEDIMRLGELWTGEYPHLISQYSLGRSVEEREIVAFKIRADVSSARPEGVPMVKYVANMHGDESVGREMVLALTQYLLTNYATEERIGRLLNTTEIHLVPSMNPDGFERVTRNNYNEVDLNREFPGLELLDTTEEFLFKDREPEVAALMRWILDNPFVVAINFHDGAVVANYPYDQRNLEPWTVSDRFRAVIGDPGNSETPDKDEFVMLSKLYADNHGTMSLGNAACGKFKDGITNGAEWYEVAGGMQDFNYLYTNCMEITLELSCVKKPLAQMLSSEWENNREAMISYLQTAAASTHGVVKDTQGNPVNDAHVEVIGRARDLITADTGEYWRILTPGTYKMRAKKGEMISPEVELTVPADWLQSPGQRIDLVLSNPVSSTSSTTTTTTTTSTTTETPEEEEEGTNLYILPGICVNISLSLTPIRSCKE